LNHEPRLTISFQRLKLSKSKSKGIDLRNPISCMNPKSCFP